MKIVYIDVQNTHKATQKLWWLIDWRLFFEYLHRKIKPDIVYYAVGYLPELQSHYESIRSYWYTMLFKATTKLPNGEIKWNVDIDIAIRSTLDFCRNWLQKAYVVTNDGDYNTLIDILQQENVFWWLILPDAYSASHLIKRLAKDFIDIQRIKHIIQKQKDSP